MRVKSFRAAQSVLIVCACLIFIGCGGKNEGVTTSGAGEEVAEVKAAEAEQRPEVQEIRSVRINDLLWMAEDLEVDVFRNGDTIPYARDSKKWLEAGQKQQPAWCYYETKDGIDMTYGRLYNYYAVNDPRGLAPEGWEIPTIKDFEMLAENLGGEKFAGAKLKSEEGWLEGGNGNNESGFSGTPGGMRNFVGAFSNHGTFGYWWSITDRPKDNAWHFNLNHKSSIAKTFFSQKGNGFSVRCVKR